MFYIGTEDENGDVIPKFDEYGKSHSRHKENYSQEEFEIIQNILGKTVQKRYINNKYIYDTLGINAQFNKFPETHNSVTQKHNGSYIY